MQLQELWSGRRASDGNGILKKSQCCPRALSEPNVRSARMALGLLTPQRACTSLPAKSLQTRCRLVAKMVKSALVRIFLALVHSRERIPKRDGGCEESPHPTVEVWMWEVENSRSFGFQ